MAYTHTEWKQEGTTVYALNLEGTNRFSARVEGGWATQNRTRTDLDELEANARLISAAPDLLAALESLMDSLGAMTNRHELHGYMSDDDAAVVYAALGKAKGAKP